MAKTVLLADDSVTIRKVVELTFNGTPIRVESVGTGREALERFVETRPDLVLADVVMPEPSGYEVCTAVKNSPHPVPVLLLAGTFEPFDAERASTCGADGHLLKPFECRTLYDRVDELLSAAARGAAAAPADELPGREASERVTTEEGPPAVDEQVPEPLASPAEESATQEPSGACASPEPVEEVLDELAASAVAATGPGAAPVGEDAEWILEGGVEDGRESLSEPGEAEEPVASEAQAAEESERALPVGVRLSEDDLEAIVRAVVDRLSDRVVREIAAQVVPAVAEAIVRERIRQLEREEPSGP